MRADGGYDERSAVDGGIDRRGGTMDDM